jgi:hypothetical protein
MHLKFNSHTTDTRLVHVMFNEVIHHALQDEIAYAGKLKKLMQININNSTRYPYIHANMFGNNGLQNVIDRAVNMNFEHMVIWFDGSWPGASEFDDRLLESIDSEWSTTRWLAAGHIINHHTRGDAPQWHQQCIVINLKTYKEIGSPDLTHWDADRNYPHYKFSEENLHDDYTPLWIAAEDAEINGASIKQTIKDVEYMEGILNELFPIAFSNNCVIHNFGYSIRDEKLCCYPEDDIEFTKSWLFDYDFNARHTIDELREFCYDKISEDKRELFQYKIMDTHIMYVTNTEDVPDGAPLGIDTLVVPCSGLHQFKHISNNRDTIKRILWTDFSPFGVAWTKHVLENWDGVDFNTFFINNRHVIMELGLPSDEFIWYEQSSVENFINSYENENDWLEHWDFIRSLDHQFVKIDVVKEWKRLADLIGNEHTVLLQLSNIWQYEINYINTPAFTAQSAFIDLFNELLTNNETIYFTGDTPNGNYLEYQNMRLLPGVI